MAEKLVKTFTVRVELHNVITDPEKVYAQLHKAMAEEGFKRIITGADKIEYHLPNAEYTITPLLKDKYKVLELTKKAAETTKHKFSVLVTESAGRIWSNLEKVIKQ